MAELGPAPALGARGQPSVTVAQPGLPGMTSHPRQSAPSFIQHTTAAKMRFASILKRDSASTSEDSWKADDPFGPPHIPSSAVVGIKRLGHSLSHKISPSAFAEREFLRKENRRRYKTPLTERNIDFLLIQQEREDARHSVRRTREVQVSEWLRQLS